MMAVPPPQPVYPPYYYPNSVPAAPYGGYGPPLSVPYVAGPVPYNGTAPQPGPGAPPRAPRRPYEDQQEPSSPKRQRGADSS